MSTQAAQLRIKELEGELLEKEVALQGLQAQLEARQAWLTEVGEAVRNARLNRRNTQGFMAGWFDLPVSDWSALENGKLPHRFLSSQETSEMWTQIADDLSTKPIITTADAYCRQCMPCPDRREDDQEESDAGI